MQYQPTFAVTTLVVKISVRQLNICPSYRVYVGLHFWKKKIKFYKFSDYKWLIFSTCAITQHTHTHTKH